jgi:hypothetical protein
LASSYLRDKRAADRRKAEEKKQKKLEQYVQMKARRAVRDGKNYQPRAEGKNAEEHSKMVAIAKKTMSELAGKMEKKMVTVAQNITDKSTKKLETKLDVTDKVANDAMAAATQAMTAEVATAERVAAMGTEHGEAIEGLRKSQEVLEHKLLQKVQIALDAQAGSVVIECRTQRQLRDLRDEMQKMIEAKVSEADLRALDDRVQRIAAEIQTMNKEQRIESEEQQRHTRWLGGLGLLMKDVREQLGQLRNQAEQNQQPGTSSTPESQGTSCSNDSL